MMELVFLLEEPSAKAMLESLLPRLLGQEMKFRCIPFEGKQDLARLLGQEMKFRCIPFEGKQDLEKQLVRKIRGYQNDQARFIVLRDQDSHPDCNAVKRRLLDLCNESGKADRCLVRIACRELEAVYLADLLTFGLALEIHGLAKRQRSRKFRTPDTLGSPSKELKTLTGNRYEKVAGSRAIGLHLSLDNERSPSFRNLIAAIRRMENEFNKEHA